MNLYWDRTNRKLVQATDDTTEIGELELVARDLEAMSVAVMDYSDTDPDDPYDIVSLASGTVAIGIKSDLDGSYLAYADLVSNAGVGDARRYTGDLDLNTTELIAALVAADEDDILVVGELTIVTADGQHTYSTQFDVHIYKDVIRGERPPPTSGGGLAVRFYTDENGNKWVRIYNEDGVLVLALPPPGV